MIRWFCLIFFVLSTTVFAVEPSSPADGIRRSAQHPELPRWANDIIQRYSEHLNFELNKGDHLVILGNALAEGMMHDGSFEALLYALFPEHDLVIRNLGHSGDEIGGYTSKPDPMQRLRSMDYGTADQWLHANAPVPQPDKLKLGAPVKANRFENIGTKPDVIIAMFGYNESFAGEAGLSKFKEALTDFIKHQRSQKYNDKTPPRLVICSPIAHENLNDPNLPDGRENNERIQLYTQAMREICSQEKVAFVNLRLLMASDVKRYPLKPGEHLTTNGIFLKPEGYSRLSGLLASKFTRWNKDRGVQQGRCNHSDMLDLVHEKNAHWFQRHRTPDGYSIYGDRAFLKFTDGQTNYEVLQRELEVLDQLVNNYEAAIHRLARGEKNVKADNTNLPPFLPVVTNKPGKNPDGSHTFLSGEEALQHMTVHKDLQVNLFADEKQFPELVNPVQMSFDTRGRLWVAVWPTYPHWKPYTRFDNKLLIFEDTDNDGKADVCKTFADNLQNPTGFEFWNGGVIVAQANEVTFFKDTDGDDEYDIREGILHGLDTADTHHTANSFVLDPGGALYFQEGIFHHSQVETPWGPPRRNINGGVYRYEPRTRKFDVYAAYDFANPHGHVFDRWGNNIILDATSGIPYHGTLLSGHVNFPAKHTTPPPAVYKQRVRPCSGLEWISSTHLPESMRGNLWVANVLGLQGILQYKIEANGASLKGTEEAPILISDDPNFRPADIEQAPDGSVYFLDWHNPIIGHMQHHLRDPNRNKDKGRIYRITHKSNPLQKPEKIAGEPVFKLIDLLQSPDDRVRYRARIELSARSWAMTVVSALLQLQDFNPKSKDFEHFRLEVLWLHQQHNHVNAELLEQVLKSPEPQARAAAVRVAWAWRERLPNIVSLLTAAAGDKAPNVRLEAIRAASFLEPDKAFDIVQAAQEQPQDEYLNYVTNETVKALEARQNESKAE